MKYLKIANEGKMEVGALTLLGGSSKRGDDSKIGMFGSGNKYALAYFLRNNIDVKIYSGLEEIKVTVENTEFRDQSYGVIHINGLPTSITTGSGPKWEFWHSIREIYSNALDEGFIEMRQEDEIMPIDGETHFYIEMNEDTQDFFENLDKYFSKGRDFLYTEKEGSILPRKYDSLYVYRMGIRCFAKLGKSLFDYNLMNVAINESRVASSIDVNKEVANLLLQCPKENIIKKFYQDSMDFDVYENQIEVWTNFDPMRIHQNWLEYLPQKYVAMSIHGLILDNAEIAECQIVSEFFFKMLTQRFGDEIIHPALRGGSSNKQYRDLPISENENFMLKKAKEFLDVCQFDYGFVNEIKVVKFPNATDSKVFKQEKLLCIDRRMFDSGLRKIVHLIIDAQFQILSDQNGEYDITEAINWQIGYMSKCNAYMI